MNYFDKACISTSIWMTRAKDRVSDFLKSQDGVSNVVATIVILLIVVLLIGVFWDRLKEWVGGIMDQIFDTKIDGNGLQ